MAGLIKQDSIQEVRQRTNIEDVVSEHVQLRTAGVGAKKGLCPFHDEKSPSFTVRVHHGTYHCFGCGENGDAISFLQKLEHLTFVDAVERLAARAGLTLAYEEGARPRDAIDHGSRQRLLQAHELATEFYIDKLKLPEAGAARQFLAAKGFDRNAAAQFGVGYAPKGWDSLQKFLRERGFNDKELVQSGLLTEGQRGAYDRFRGRVMWPIRDIMGATIGFGARKLYDDDPGPKYLNTPETPIYKKSQVLYGLDLAKREISKTRKVVIVEGYTDVMAAHLSGVPQAVATCGTAFGDEHIRLVRRLIGDVDRASGVTLATDNVQRGEVIFTFDGDAAGQKAALKAYNDDAKFQAQTFVAVAEGGLDPCDLRLQRGDAAVRALIEGRRPLFEFAIETVLHQVDLDTLEGRVAALRAAAPIVASIRDQALRGEYARRLAGWLGMDVEDVRKAVAGAAKRLAAAPKAASGAGNSAKAAPEQRQYPQEPNQGRAASGAYAGSVRGDVRGNGSDHEGSAPRDEFGAPYVAEYGANGGDSTRFGARLGASATNPYEVASSAPIRLRDVANSREPISGNEARALGAVLQVPHLVDAAFFDQLPPTTFSVPALRSIHEALIAAGGVAPVSGQPAHIAGFTERLHAALPEVFGALLADLTNLSIPARDEREAAQYVHGLLQRAQEMALTREIAELRSRLARNPHASLEETQAVMSRLVLLDQQKRALKASW